MSGFVNNNEAAFFFSMAERNSIVTKDWKLPKGSQQVLMLSCKRDITPALRRVYCYCGKKMWIQGRVSAEAKLMFLASEGLLEHVCVDFIITSHKTIIEALQKLLGASMAIFDIEGSNVPENVRRIYVTFRLGTFNTVASGLFAAWQEQDPVLLLLFMAIQRCLHTMFPGVFGRPTLGIDSDVAFLAPTYWQVTTSTGESPIESITKSAWTEPCR